MKQGVPTSVDEYIAAQPEAVRPYLKAREFVGMEKKITEAEQELSVLRTTLEDPVIMSDAPRLQVTCAQIEEAQKKVEGLYARWAELEQKHD